MFRLKLYYFIKPTLPWGLRMTLRRFFAKRTLKKVSHHWPINEAAAKKPDNWPGWPEGKQFAFVLTHDVEGQEGLNKVRKLAELEAELGFRSSFNFVPDGQYETPDELIAWLIENGFEVGVHDHRHDGKLYASRKAFTKAAEIINRYIEKWGASGFRSGFMLRNLDWLHDLNIQYDASTFDTDPFEPQPDGLGTIFPKWIPNPFSNQQFSIRNSSSQYRESSGYVELPYTLPQDSTLFLLLQEGNSDLWKNKLDWIAENGGMALLNTHPDYISFSEKSLSPQEYPVSQYRDFLTHAKSIYNGSYWHALPQKIAAYRKSAKPEKPAHRPRNICMLAFTDYESDGRIIRYAKTLSKRGDTVDVIACTQEGEPLGVSNFDGVTLHKIFRRKQNRKGGAVSHFIPLIFFALKAFVILTRNHLRRNYDLIHVHNIPEWLVFSTWIPRLSGTKIILDLHDLVPELFAAKFKKGSRSLFDSSLKLLERWSCQFSDHVIISNDLWKRTVTQRSVTEDRCSVFFNNIDPELFYPRKKTRQDNTKIVIFPGTLQWHQGVDIVIRAFPQIVAAIPTAEFHIYGGGGVIHELQALVSDLDLQDTVLFKGSLPISEIPQTIANADVGVVPKRADSFGNEAYSTKIMEFMSQGLPTVISRTAIDDFYFDESQTRFCESGNIDEFAQAIIEIFSDEELRARITENATAYVAANDWSSKKQEYLNIVDRLIAGSNSSISNQPRIHKTPEKKVQVFNETH